MSNPLVSPENRPLEQLKVAELRDELRKRGLSLKGVKKELFERLEEAIRKEGQPGSPHGGLGIPEDGKRAPEVVRETPESEEEGGDDRNKKKEVPFEAVEEEQGDVVMVSQDMMKERTLEANDYDPVLPDGEPQEGIDNLDSAYDPGHVKSSLTDSEVTDREKPQDREPQEGAENVVNSGNDDIETEGGGCEKSSFAGSIPGTCLQDHVEHGDAFLANSHVSGLTAQDSEELKVEQAVSGVNFEVFERSTEELKEGAVSCVNSEVSELPLEKAETLQGGLEAEHSLVNLTSGHLIAETITYIPTTDLRESAESSRDVERSEVVSGVKVEASGISTEHSEILQVAFESVKEELEHPSGQFVSEVIIPSVQNVDTVQSTGAPSDVEMEVDSINRDAKTEEVGILTGVTQPTRSELAESDVDEKVCSPMVRNFVDVKAEPGQSEVQLQSRYVPSGEEGEEYKLGSPKSEEVRYKTQYMETPSEKSRQDSVGSQKNEGDEQMALEAKGRGLSNDWTEDMKNTDLKAMDFDTQPYAGQKRKDDDRDRQQEPAKRQRRWNSGNKLGGDVRDMPKPLTTGSMKEIMSLDNKEVHVAVELHPKPSPSTPKILATTRPAPPPFKGENSDNGEKGKQRAVPPATVPPTTSLKVERFVRPFTLKALKDLLTCYGEVIDFWVDQIKTHCYVTFSSVDKAITARNDLYYKQWPPSFGNSLVAEFVDPHEVKVRCEGLLEKSGVSPGTTPRMISDPFPTQVTPAAMPVHAQTVPLPPPPPLRERPALLPKNDPEPQIPTLEDLFKKTKAKPHIYYLPLTDEQVAAKLAAKAREQPPKTHSSTIRA